MRLNIARFTKPTLNIPYSVVFVDVILVPKGLNSDLLFMFVFLFVFDVC